MKTDNDTRANRERSRWLIPTGWVAGAILLLAVAGWQWAKSQGTPPLERPAEQSFRDLQRIQLVSRELTSHPYLPGKLRLSATIVNRAAKRQPYPDIEVSLLDAAGQVVSQKRFKPADYLEPDRAPGASMAPEAYLPLVLDIEDPGEQAVGFELNFK